MPEKTYISSFIQNVKTKGKSKKSNQTPIKLTPDSPPVLPTENLSIVADAPIQAERVLATSIKSSDKSSDKSSETITHETQQPSSEDRRLRMVKHPSSSRWSNDQKDPSFSLDMSAESDSFKKNSKRTASGRSKQQRRDHAKFDKILETSFEKVRENPPSRVPIHYVGFSDKEIDEKLHGHEILRHQVNSEVVKRLEQKKQVRKALIVGFEEFAKREESADRRKRYQKYHRKHDAILKGANQPVTESSYASSYGEPSQKSQHCMFLIPTDERQNLTMNILLSK